MTPDSVERKPLRQRPGDVWREARSLVWAHRRRLLVGLMLLAVSRLASLVLPATSKYVIDDVIGDGRSELLLPLALAAGVAVLVQGVTSFTLSQVLGVAAERSISDLRRRVLRHVLQLPVRYFDSTKTGVLLSRVMNDAEGIRTLVGSGLVQLAGGLITATAAFSVLLYLNWSLTLLIFTIVVLYGAGLAAMLRRLRPLYRQRQRIRAEVSGRLAEALAGVRVVKSYTAEGREGRVFAAGIHRLLRTVARLITTSSTLTSGTMLVFGLLGIVVMLVGTRAILDGGMTLGDLAMFLAFTGMALLPLGQIAAIGTQLTEAFAGLDRIRELESYDSEHAGRGHGRALAEVRGEVRFERVTFGYQAQSPVLHDVSFTATAGTTTALVGASGAGKTTLISLLGALHEPDSGTIFIDGHKLRSLSLRDYRAHLGVVLQETFLFDGTVAENVAYARPRASRDEILRAGAVAHCDEFVNGFELGYDTVVGERGVKLSGGQRQRVAIARAILADPRILLLDEATSSLDSETEALIRDGLRALRRGRTTFVIAHRFSTILAADQILVLDRGRIVERGRHRELLAAGGRYSELYESQAASDHDLFLNPGEATAP